MEKIFQGLRKLIQLRKSLACLYGHEMRVMNTENRSVLEFLRMWKNKRAILQANFFEAEQRLLVNLLRIYGLIKRK